MADKELNFKITGDTSGLSKATRQTKTDLRQASSVVRRSRTEYEKYADELEKVNRLEKRGALDAGQAAKARQSLSSNRRRGPGAAGELASAAGLGGIINAAAPLTAALAATTIATRQLTNVIERANMLRDRARTTGLSAEFISALQTRGRRDRVTPGTTQAVQNAVAQRVNITGQDPREALRDILAPSAGLDERSQRLVRRQMIPGAGADVTRIRAPEPGLGVTGQALGRFSNKLETIWNTYTEAWWNQASRVASGDVGAVGTFIAPAIFGPGQAGRMALDARGIVNDMAIEDEF